MDGNGASEQESKDTGMFVGGIPPFLLFDTEYHSLDYLVESHKNEPLYQNINPATKAALISLVAHFEAFCKHQFAALVNIWPALLRGFAERRPQASVPLADLAICFDNVRGKIGFLLAEQYDFGTATQINGLFRDLLNVTPFSGDDAKTYDTIPMQRHLLVHHAGYYTLQHLKKHGVAEEVLERAFKDCIVIETADFQKMSEFMFEMAMKVARTTVEGFNRKWKASRPDSKHPTDSLQQLLTGVWDILDDVSEP